MKVNNRLLIISALVIMPILLLAAPRDLQIFTDWEDVPLNESLSDPEDVVIGITPNSVLFEGGIATGLLFFFPITYSQENIWFILNGQTGTVTFETPAFEVQFYAANFLLGDGSIDVFDTNDNLLTRVEELPTNINPVETPNPQFVKFNANELGAPGGIRKILLNDDVDLIANFGAGYGTSFTAIDDFGFTPIADFEPPPVSALSITTQPISQEVQSGNTIVLTVAASGDDVTYQWYIGNTGDTASPVAGATGSSLTTGALTVSMNFWVQVTNAGGTANSDTAVITVAAPSVPLVLEGSGNIAGENIQHPNGNIFDQVLLTGESIQLQAKPNQITRVSFMDEDEDIVQVEFSGSGSFTVTMDPETFLPSAIPPRYNQAVEYVTGKPSIVIDGADANTFFSIFTVGSINAVNQALFPEGQVYDAEADVTLVEVINSTGIGGMQLSNTIFTGSTGKVGVDAHGVPIAVRLTVGDIDASENAVPHLLFGTGSFTQAAGNSGLRITGGDLAQTNGASIVVAESGTITPGFETLITQNNFKSDNTPQPTQSINATFVNADGEEVIVLVEEITIE